MALLSRMRLLRLFVGGKNGAPLDGATPTGYYLKKYVVETISLNPNNTTTDRHVWILFRYAEVLLNYAEALYEAYGNPDYTDNTFTLSPRVAIDKVRARAGMPGVASDDFLERIRNERRVELAFEDHPVLGCQKMENRSSDNGYLWGED